MTRLIQGIDSNNIPRTLLVDANGSPIVTKGGNMQNTVSQLISETDKTTTTITGLLTNQDYRGAIYYFRVSAVPGVDTVQFKMFMLNNDADESALVLQDDAQVGTGARRILLYPAAINTHAGFDKIGSVPLPYYYKIQILHSGGGAFSYYVDEMLLH